MTPVSQVVIICCVLLFIYSLDRNNIGAAGAQAVAGALQHCINLQTLK